MEKLTRSKQFAMAMVSACLPYIDERRETDNFIEMVDITQVDKADNLTTYFMTVMVCGRERLKAVCRVHANNVGFCQIANEDGRYRRDFRCCLEREGGRHGLLMQATPLYGPGSAHLSLNIRERSSFETKLTGAIAGDWDIWAEADDYLAETRIFGAWRKSWILNAPLRGTFAELVLQIATYELEHQDGSLSETTIQLLASH
jgi:hypothetical protein